jgi:hypothetical protein
MFLLNSLRGGPSNVTHITSQIWEVPPQPLHRVTV